MSLFSPPIAKRLKTHLNTTQKENCDKAPTSTNPSNILFNPFSNDPNIKMNRLLITQQQQKQQFVAQNLNNFLKQNENQKSAFSALNAMARLNPNLFTLKPPTISNSNLFYCFVCNKNFDSQSAYMLHWSIVHLKTPISNLQSFINTDYEVF